LYSSAFADDFDFLAETETNEEIEIDPITQWPHKVILDSNSKKLMLVWFDDSTMSNTTFSFNEVQQLISIPSDGGLGAELQVETVDGKRYIVAYGYGGTQQQSLLLSALIGVNIKTNTEVKRIANIALKKRAEPQLVVGSITDPNVLKPTGKVVEDKLLHSSAVGEEIGDNIPKKSSGSLSRASIELEIKRNMNRFRGCYQKALGQVPDLQGMVQIQFSVGKGGAVAGARISSSTLKNALAERCILRHIYGIRFEEPQGGTAIFNYPFTFTRRE
jgi:hypothetical protein